MINTRKLRSLWESSSKSAATALDFVTQQHHLLGLCDENGNKYRDHAGNPIIKNAKVRAEDYNLHECAQAVLGENWAEIVEGKTSDAQHALRQQALLESGTGVGVDPSAGININAFSGLTSGLIERKAKLRVIRDGVVIHTGELSSLKRFKDDVKEVTKGYECGLQVERYNDIEVGDYLEIFKTEEVKRKL